MTTWTASGYLVSNQRSSMLSIRTPLQCYEKGLEPQTLSREARSFWEVHKPLPQQRQQENARDAPNFRSPRSNFLTAETPKQHKPSLTMGQVLHILGALVDELLRNTGNNFEPKRMSLRGSITSQHQVRGKAACPVPSSCSFMFGFPWRSSVSITSMMFLQPRTRPREA